MSFLNELKRRNVLRVAPAYRVCPVPKCITMNEVDIGLPYLNWIEHPNNPMK